MSRKIVSMLVVFVGTLLSTGAALAKEGDVEACSGKSQGDACTRADGDAGTCSPDDSDPNVLTCDDDATGAGGSSSGDDGGCSGSDGSTTSSSNAPVAAFALLGLGAFGRTRRAALRRGRITSAAR
jgi:hypothetical protein